MQSICFALFITLFKSYTKTNSKYANTDLTIMAMKKMQY